MHHDARAHQVPGQSRRRQDSNEANNERADGRGAPPPLSIFPSAAVSVTVAAAARLDYAGSIGRRRRVDSYNTGPVRFLHLIFRQRRFRSVDWIYSKFNRSTMIGSGSALQSSFTGSNEAVVTQGIADRLGAGWSALYPTAAPVQSAVS